MATRGGNGRKRWSSWVDQEVMMLSTQAPSRGSLRLYGGDAQLLAALSLPQRAKTSYERYRSPGLRPGSASQNVYADIYRGFNRHTLMAARPPPGPLLKNPTQQGRGLGFATEAQQRSPQKRFMHERRGFPAGPTGPVHALHLELAPLNNKAPSMLTSTTMRSLPHLTRVGELKSTYF